MTMTAIRNRKPFSPPASPRKWMWVLLAAVLFGGLAFVPNGAEAFTYNVIHTFSGGPSDGSQPLAGLTRRGPTSLFLYGTTCSGGTGGLGTVYRFDRTNPASTYTVMYNFGSTSAPVDGSCPAADLAYQGGMGGRLYGTTQFGGASAAGTVFQIISNPPFPYTQLYAFLGGADGSQPEAQVIPYGGALWGTTGFDGAGSACCAGTVFTLTPPTEAPVFSFPVNDGHSTIGLTRVGSVFYGATQKFNCGHIFSSAAGYAAIYTLVGATDGCHITSRLLKRGSSLYGVTQGGGAFGCGTLFQFVLPAGPYTARYNFQCGPTDGDGPTGDIAFYNGKFYGTTQFGGGIGCGGSGCGTVFEITPSTTYTETFLYPLNGASDGATPLSGVKLLYGALYGTASAGGSGDGTIFKVQ